MPAGVNMEFTFWFSLIVFLFSLNGAIRIVVGRRKIVRLSDVTPVRATNALRVSIIFSALNEAETIEPALRSMLALDYTNLEIIAINDRSTDATGAILDRISREHPVLRVLHITELPAGWLGKNHALHQGAAIATGTYLLFTDADVLFDPTAISRAVARCEQERLDHLVVLADLIVRQNLLAMLLLNGYVFMYSRHRPWKVRTSKKHHMGMGAFNMVRTSAYRQAGGHRALALEVVDDIMLGKLMKLQGHSQEVLHAAGMVTVEWYRNAYEMMKGLEKNSLAMLDYQAARLLPLSVLILALRYWPWIGLFTTGGAAWWLNLASLVVGLSMFVDLLRSTPWSRWCLLYWPVVGLASLFIIWRGVVLTLMRDGINWRGTHYALSELKRNHH